MDDGTAFALAIGGVAVVGVGAYFILRGPPAPAPVPTIGGYPPGYPVTASAAPTPPAGAPPAVPSAAQQLIDGFNDINQAGCAMIAKKGGAPAILADAGCSAYAKFINPVTQLQFIGGEVEKIPVVGGAVKSVVSAATAVGDATYSGAKSVVSKVFSIF